MRHYINQNKFLLALAIAVSVISSLGYVGIAVLLQKLLDIAITQNMPDFMRILFLSLGYFALLGVSLYLQSLLAKKVICKIVHQLRQDAFHGILNRTLERFSRENTASYISALTNDVKIIEESFLLPLFEIIQYSVIFAASLILMICFDIFVTICVAAAIAVLFIVPGLLGGVLEKRQDKFSRKLSDLTAYLKDTFSGFEVIKSYTMEKYIAARFTQSNIATVDAKYSSDKILALNEGLSAFLALMVQVAVLFLSAYFVLIGRITAGTLLGMVQVSSNLANPLVMIFTNIPKMKSIAPIMERLEAFSAYRPDNCQGKPVDNFSHSIRVRNLFFSYDRQKDILHDFNCVFEKNKKYALVGKSGCGKTTLIHLLTGIYSGYDGEILYDDREIGSLNKNDVLALSSIIHQSIYLFDGSIRDNICLHEEYPPENIDRAVEDSGLGEFIAKLPEGLSYRTGENGSNLSGGQRQRIALARALIRNKPVLILDEGTSALDRETAFDIENRLLKMKDLTLITVTHHLDERLLPMYDEIISVPSSL